MMKPLLGAGCSVPCPLHVYVRPCVPEPRAGARPPSGWASTLPALERDWAPPALSASQP